MRLLGFPGLLRVPSHGHFHALLGVPISRATLSPPLATTAGAAASLVAVVTGGEDGILLYRLLIPLLEGVEEEGGDIIGAACQRRAFVRHHRIASGPAPPLREGCTDDVIQGQHPARTRVPVVNVIGRFLCPVMQNFLMVVCAASEDTKVEHADAQMKRRDKHKAASQQLREETQNLHREKKAEDNPVVARRFSEYRCGN